MILHKSIGIISIKGGVGKTSCTANLGAALAHEFGKSVVLVDANYSAPNLGLHFGLTNPDVHLHDVLRNRVDIGDAIHEYDEKLHILPGSLLNEKIDPYKLRTIVQHLKKYYDIVLIDSSPNLNDEIKSVMLAADELLVVTNPDYPTLSTTMHAVKVAREKRVPIMGLVLNRVRNKAFELSIEEIEGASTVPVIGILPEDLTIPESIAYTTPAVFHKPLGNVSVEMKKLAAAIIHKRYHDPRLSTRLKQLFGKTPLKVDINREFLRKGVLY
jgi:septum site-determining protein MinD